MAKVAELTEALNAKGEPDRPPPNDELDGYSRQPYPSHLEARGEENDVREKDLYSQGQGREKYGKSYVSSNYKSKRIDLKDEDWEKKLEKIMEKKIRTCMREKGLLDPTDIW